MKNGLYENLGARPATALTPGQRTLLAWLAGAARTENELAARWPTRTREDILATAASLADLGLAARLADGWAITGSGRKTLNGEGS